MSSDSSILSDTFSNLAEQANRVKEVVCSHIFGQEHLVDDTLCSFLASGHILITGAPGLAKTTLVREFSRALALSAGRIQFTPDLLPADIIGTEILQFNSSSQEKVFEFRRGPIFTNLLLADEINRAQPRTQSAMLEAMQERQVTFAGKGHELANPFMVLATQNPFESEGTFPLPEAQLDRFIIHSFVNYPDVGAELKILEEHNLNRLAGETKNLSRKPLVDIDPLQMIAACKTVRVDNEIIQAINTLVRASRPENEHFPKRYQDVIWYGAGPRAGISLISVSKAFAMLSNEEIVRWKHVKRMAPGVLRHRVKFKQSYFRDGLSEEDFIKDLIEVTEKEHSLLAKGMK